MHIYIYAYTLYLYAVNTTWKNEMCRSWRRVLGLPEKPRDWSIAIIWSPGWSLKKHGLNGRFLVKPVGSCPFLGTSLCYVLIDTNRLNPSLSGSPADAPKDICDLCHQHPWSVGSSLEKKETSTNHQSILGFQGRFFRGVTLSNTIIANTYDHDLFYPVSFWKGTKNHTDTTETLMRGPVQLMSQSCDKTPRRCHIAGVILWKFHEWTTPPKIAINLELSNIPKFGIHLR